MIRDDKGRRRDRFRRSEEKAENATNQKFTTTRNFERKTEKNEVFERDCYSIEVNDICTVSEDVYIEV